MSYQDLIDSYINDGFEVTDTKKTKLAKWELLHKPQGWFTNVERIFIYFVDGKVRKSHMNEFIKTLIQLYEGEYILRKHKAVFVHSEELDTDALVALIDKSSIDGFFEIKHETVISTKKKTAKIKRTRLAKASKTLILNSQHHKCADCKTDISKLPVNYDHRIPLALGGVDEIENIQALCPNCHALKTQKDRLAISRARA